MPLPWKKFKSSRIAGVFADLQSLPNRRDSLVVETGFPTSLIDVLVKNQDRLKKPSKKKNKKKKPEEVPRSVLQTFPNSPNRTVAPILCEKQRVPASPNAQIDTGTDSEDVGGAKSVAMAEVVVGDGDGDGDGVVLGAGGVFWPVLKIFLVVILALATKKMVVGLTMSACLLFLLELVGKYVRPSFVVQKRFSSFLVQRALILFRREQRKEILEDENFVAVADDDSSCAVVGLGESGASTDEIKMVECNSDSIEPQIEIQSAEPNLEPRLGPERKNSLKSMIENDEDGDAIEIQKRRSGKLKSKMMKRLVPKKLRKKGNKGKCNEQEPSDSCECREGSTLVGKDREEEIVEDGEKSMSNLSNSSEEEENRGEEAETNAALSSEGELLLASVGGAPRDGEELERPGCVMLLLIALAGLAGGMVLALAFTIAGAVMLKSVGAMRRRCKNLRMGG